MASATCKKSAMYHVYCRCLLVFVQFVETLVLVSMSFIYNHERHTHSSLLRLTLLAVETLVLHCAVADVRRESPYSIRPEASHPVTIQEADPRRGINAANLWEKVQNPFTYSLNLSSPPSGCTMWQPTENSLCKINSFQRVSHAKLPSTPASGECGHQPPHTNRSIVFVR